MLIWIYYFSLNIGYVSIEGHFPYATDKNFHQYLAIGPVARYAEDLKPTLSVMAGDKASKLKLYDTVILMLTWLELGYWLGVLPKLTEFNRGIKVSLSQRCVLIPELFIYHHNIY